MTRVTAYAAATPTEGEPPVEYDVNPITFVIWVACLIGCIVLGNNKDRVVLGVLLGIFCGFIGLIIMAVVPAKSRY